MLFEQTVLRAFGDHTFGNIVLIQMMNQDVCHNFIENRVLPFSINFESGKPLLKVDNAKFPTSDNTKPLMK